jgi:hypothetical protein
MRYFFFPFRVDWYCLCLVGLLACQPDKPAAVVEAEATIPATVDFNLHVKPILSDRYFACHGPDVANQQANLRLDTEAGLFAALAEGNGHVIVSSSQRHSEVYQRIVVSYPEGRGRGGRSETQHDILM